MLLSILLLSMNCASTKGDKQNGDDEMAAQILIENPGVADFQSLDEPIDDATFIMISLEKVIFMSGWKSKLDLTYNKTSKSWNGEYVVHTRPIRGSHEKDKTDRFENLKPKISWQELMQALNKNNIHSIRDSEDIDYKEVLADGENYSLNIRVGDQQRTYSCSNPGFYANEYSEITDFKDFAAIIDILDREFIAGLE